MTDQNKSDTRAEETRLNSEEENAQNTHTQSAQGDNQPDSAETKETQKTDEVDWKSRYFYLAAEMENSRKRFEREKESYLKFGSEKILSDIVEVADHFERTLEMLRADQDPKMKNVVYGLDMVMKIFLDSFAKHGLSQLQSLGKDFDPNFHEAVGQEYKEGTRPHEIIKEFQKGYVLNGRLLRAAKVIVASDKQ